MTIKEGDTLPEVTLHHMTEKGPTPITSSELFRR
jgi:peroxiredoxin